MKAYSALALVGGKAIGDLTADLKASSFGVGAAAEAAERRLDNFLGAMKLFGSSLEAMSIEFFGPMLGAFKETTQDMTGALNSVLFSIQGINAANESFNMAAGRQAKDRASDLATELGLVDKLGARQAANAQAGLAAITRSMIGEEKITRAQRASRAQGFATFIEQGLTRQKLSSTERQQARERLKQIVETAKAQGLSATQERGLREEFMESLAAQKSGVKKLGAMQGVREAQRIEAIMEKRALEAKVEAEARGLLEQEKKLAEVEEKHGRTARLIAEGVLDALKSIKDGFKTLIQQVKNFAERMRESIGEDNLKRFTKIATIAVVIAGALAPVLIGFMGIAFVMKSVLIPQITGVAKILLGLSKIAIGLTSGALLPIVAVVGVVAVAFMLFRKEGESVSDTLVRAWGLIKQAVLDVWEIAIKPFIKGFTDTLMPIIDQLRIQFLDAWGRIEGKVQTVVANFKALWGGIAAFFGIETLSMGSTWESFGSTVATVLGMIVSIAIEVVSTLISVWLSFQQFLTGLFLGIWQNVIKPFWDGFVETFVPILDGLKMKFLTVWNEISGMFAVVVDTFTTLWGELAGNFDTGTEGMSMTWLEFGSQVANVIGFILGSLLDFVAAAVKGFLWLTNVLAPTIILPFTTLWNEGRRVLSGIIDIFKGNFASGITKVMLGLENVLLLPLRMMLKLILQIANALPARLVNAAVSKSTFASLQKFADVGVGPAPGKRRPTAPAVAKAVVPEAGAEVIDLRAERRRRRGVGAIGAIKGLEKGLESKVVELPKTLAEQTSVSGVLAFKKLKETPENVKLAQTILKTSATMRKEEKQERRKAAKAADRKLEAKVVVKDERKTTIKNSMCVDGHEMATATATHKQSVFERSGGVTEPYNRLQRAQTGIGSREVA